MYVGEIGGQLSATLENIKVKSYYNVNRNKQL